jgi:hypothetical protein
MIPTPVGGNSVLSAITKVANGKGNWNNGVFKQLVKGNTVGYQLKQPKQNFYNEKKDHLSNKYSSSTTNTKAKAKDIRCEIKEVRS